MAEMEYTKRPESWVAVVGDEFYKIPRLSNFPLDDMADERCIEIAIKEFKCTTSLANLSSGVLRPTRIEKARITYPAISGPDLRDFLLGATSDAARGALRQAMQVLAELHKEGMQASRVLEEYPSGRGYFTQPDSVALRRIHSKEKSILIDGFEVRNFRFDAARQSWKYFDPHNLRRGCPECDISRFLVSLLMLRWGKTVDCRLWTAFDYRDLLDAYRGAGGCEIDSVVMNFFMRENAAMRSYYAGKSIDRMRGMMKVPATIYKSLFFNRLDRWIARHDI